MAFILNSSLSDVYLMLMIKHCCLLPVMGYKSWLIYAVHMVYHGILKFNPLKSQLITFGGCNPAQCVITICGNSIPWVPKVKYLGIIFLCNTAITDLSEVCRNFCGKFNSIMYVLGKCSNEMAALHLLKTYCLPTVMYGCEVWSVTNNSLHKVNVVWNNCFRRIFSCCWRESTRPRGTWR